VGELIDGRSHWGRFLRHYEGMLTEHVGGKPSLVQRALITRAARVALHLELMDKKSLRDARTFTVHDHNYYIAWSNALARLLARLGIVEAIKAEKTLGTVLADISAARGNDAA
jgi:hypothetical protein